jgi:hypothetical protein
VLPINVYTVGLVGDTVPLFAVPANPALVDHAYDVASGLHVAVKVAVPPLDITTGEALKVQTGALTDGIVTVVDAAAPTSPCDVTPATVYAVVSAGVTTQLAP